MRKNRYAMQYPTTLPKMFLTAKFGKRRIHPLGLMKPLRRGARGVSGEVYLDYSVQPQGRANAAACGKKMAAANRYAALNEGGKGADAPGGAQPPPKCFAKKNCCPVFVVPVADYVLGFSILCVVAAVAEKSVGIFAA
jgi:hypothetical protein